jgi:hypothetical protein
MLRTKHCTDLRTLPPGYRGHGLPRSGQDVAYGVSHVQPLQRPTAVNLLLTGPQAGRPLLLFLHQRCAAAS